LTQAISSEPSNVRVALDMVQIFLDIGEIEQAQSLFDRLPEVAQKLDIGISIASQLNFKRLAIVKLINPEKLSVNQNTLKDTLNSIYDFKQDTVAIANIKALIDVRFVFPTVNNIDLSLCLLPNILNNHTTTRCINDNGLIANMMKILKTLKTYPNLLT
jgi:hypothetical protein